ncbi:major facilitator superfamily transporter [Xylariomycetidae sp. FL0641]|nr:major facilitator superfamily transporter [Xylariomycetidae sp. FL0641]
MKSIDLGTPPQTPPSSAGASSSEGASDLERPPSRAESVWAASHISFPREVLMVFVVCMAQFCTQAAYMETLMLLRTIGATFGVTSPGRLSWLVAGYSLTVGTFILFSGRLGDAFGYKRVLLCGFAWFALWSVVAGLSAYATFELAVLARVLQGVGPAVCLPNALALCGAAYPPGHRKAMVFAFFGAVAPMGAVVGAAVAAGLSLIWWPWALWAMAVWLVVLGVLGYVAIPDLARKESPFADGFSFAALNRELDLPGVVCGVAALVLFNFAWNQSPIAGWASPVVLVPLVLGLALFGGFCYIEARVAAKPLLPFDAVNANVAFVLGVVVCGWATFGIWTLYLVQILQNVRGLSPLMTVAWFSPCVPAGGVAAIVTGKLLGPLNVRPPLVITMALAAFTTGVTLTATAPTDQIYWGQIFVSMLVMPFGMDMSFPAATLILSNAVKKEHQGIGASLVNTVVNYGIALGVGFASTVEQHVQDGDEMKGYRGALYMGIGLAGLGFAICLLYLISDLRAKKQEQGNEIAEKK